MDRGENEIKSNLKDPSMNLYSYAKESSAILFKQNEDMHYTDFSRQ